ncbi:DNA primase [candidate division WOR-3 bacterium]|nr:DNA primase [candidate division WOR-3 bacterium]
MIEKEKIEEIKRQTDIVAVISQYIKLRKVGKNYRALCPFHTEKDPSFYVNPDKGIFYCFGCKKGGNAITFLMEYEKLDFPAAVRRLAKNLGIEIDTTKGLKYKEIYEVNELACQFYSLCLTKEIGKKGQHYLNDRKIDMTKLKDFRLGYAPGSGGLVTFMRQKGISIEKLNKAGLISTSASYRQMNREIFRDRLIFPIYNVSGRVIGFGGRGIDDYIKPKYLNSPETPTFKKGEVLYGLYQSKDNIRTKGEAILVEGYFDLLSLFQKGVNNVCAPLGTSLTEKQAVLISRFSNKVNILFDGDLSGIKAALRAIGLLINAQVDVFVTSLPTGSDPDTFINQNGVDKLREVIDGAQDFFHFYKKAVKIDTVEQEVVLIKDLIQIISSIRDGIRYDRYLKYISRVFDIPIDTIMKEMASKKKTSVKSVRDFKITQEEKVMAMILNAREYFSLVKDFLKPEDFNEDGLKRLYNLLLRDKNFDIYDLSEVINETLREKLLSIIMKEETVPKQAFLEALVRYKNGIEEKRIRSKISEAQVKGDEQARTKYFKQLNALKQKMLKIDLDKVTTDSDL